MPIIAIADGPGEAAIKDNVAHARRKWGKAKEISKNAWFMTVTHKMMFDKKACGFLVWTNENGAQI